MGESSFVEISSVLNWFTTTGNLEDDTARLNNALNVFKHVSFQGIVHTFFLSIFPKRIRFFLQFRKRNFPLRNF